AMPGQPQRTCDQCDPHGAADDFVIGLLTGAVDDTVRFVVIIAVRGGRGPRPDAATANAIADSLVIFGRPESELGQFGYDLGPLIPVLVGGASAARQIFARAPAILTTGVEVTQAARGVRSAVGVGEHAGESIAARSAARDFTAAERAEVNRIGSQTGCHTCGTTNPGTKSGNFVPDHQPASALNPTGGPQRLYPQCINCSREQGLEIARQLSQGTP
ncbi:MAG: hypothetical protein ACREA9_02715, partial [Pyrinomonadaceae bacterium]